MKVSRDISVPPVTMKHSFYKQLLCVNEMNNKDELVIQKEAFEINLQQYKRQGKINLYLHQHLESEN